MTHPLENVKTEGYRKEAGTPSHLQLVNGSQPFKVSFSFELLLSEDY